MIIWRKKRKEKKQRELINAIASEVANRLSSGNNWEKFLPPVMMNGHIYMVTENGSIYRLSQDKLNDMEYITSIRAR